ncbi:MAG: DUF362 domain-containing protein [Candidatus Lokiarchaeota archaeon]|nr:DUF362 domain-containing protein [Candidatus Lokiarchaeota archaeon]
MANPTVYVKRIEGSMVDSVKECFDRFGGASKICKGKVFIKINGTTASKDAITDPEVLLAVVEVVKGVIPAENIYVMDNSAVTLPTRIVFETGKLAKRIKKAGVNVLFLDEQKPVMVEFKGVALDKPIPVPEILYEHLVKHKGENTYLNLPKLKAHIMCGVTLSIKNQHGLLYDQEKVYHHNLIDEKIVEILGMFKPDFNIIDGTTAMNFGPTMIRKEYVKPMGLLICGQDPVAVDTIGAQILGIQGVKHLKMAAEKGLGINDPAKIAVLPGPEIIEEYKVNFDHDVDKIQLDFHPLVTMFKGSEKVCKTGCLSIEGGIKGLDKKMKFRPFAVVYGKGHNTDDLDKHPGPFIVNGSCAGEELKDYFDKRRADGNTKVIFCTECLDLVQMYNALYDAGKINKFLAKWLTLKIFPLKTAWLARTARKNGGNFMML